MVLPMNTGAEAVETAIKAARKWGYDVKGVPADRATIIVADGNFHGRTTTIVSFSTDPDARRGFGPYTPGFRVVPYGDAEALADAIDETTVAVLIEPIQGEQGVVIPPDVLPARPSARSCTAHDVLLIADEIQSGLGRTGTTLASELWGVKPDLVTLGKALGGGVMPVSAVVGRADVLGVLTAGTHGSTFGGNPLACAVGLAVIGLLETGELQARATTLGLHWGARLDALVDEGLLASSRRVGLWAGLDVTPAACTGRQLCERLLARGVLAKDTHGSTIRLAPPLTITLEDLDLATDRLTRRPPLTRTAGTSAHPSVPDDRTRGRRTCTRASADRASAARQDLRRPTRADVRADRCADVAVGQLNFTAPKSQPFRLAPPTAMLDTSVRRIWASWPGGPGPGGDHRGRRAVAHAGHDVVAAGVPDAAGVGHVDRVRHQAAAARDRQLREPERRAVGVDRGPDRGDARLARTGTAGAAADLPAGRDAAGARARRARSPTRWSSGRSTGRVDRAGALAAERAAAAASAAAAAAACSAAMRAFSAACHAACASTAAFSGAATPATSERNDRRLTSGAASAAPTAPDAPARAARGASPAFGTAARVAFAWSTAACAVVVAAARLSW